MSWIITYPPEYYLQLGGEDGPQTRLAPNFNGVSQLAEYPGKLVDVDNLDGLVLEGYFGNNEGTYYSQSTAQSSSSREFHIFKIGGGINARIRGAAINITSGGQTPATGGVYRFEFTTSTIIFSFNGSVVNTVSYEVGSAPIEIDARFRIGARGDGNDSSYAFFMQGLTYNHRIGDAIFKFDDGWTNNPTMRNTGTGADGTFINMTEASWVEIPA